MTTFAEQVLAAYRAGTRVAPEGDLPASAEEAYAVQSALSAALGPVAGFKVGLKADGPPIMAPIMAARCVDSGATVAVRDHMGVELEIGWKIVGPLPAADSDDLEAALARVVLPVPVIELVDSRISGPAADDPLVKLADLQVNHGLVVGTPLTAWDGSDFGAVRGQMRVGTRDLMAPQSSVPGGSALATLAAFYRHVGGHCGGLQPGQIVITGTLHPMTNLPAGSQVSGEIEGVGAVSVTLN
ncbi:hydratase [Phaeovulum sp. W22_SRMD_FR3]|uniref:hydratase n=1 Tax=Phaeovulum sp. W22_SRMD_FR3 TaxID=3240274 RepID=UPI003F975963